MSPTDVDTIPLEEQLPEAAIEALEREMTELLTFLGKKHALTMQRHFAYSDGPLRFSDLEESLDISPNTLSTRLKEFTEAGLVTRHAYNEIPPRVEYEMTEKSRDLKPIFRHLAKWVVTHELDGEALGDLETVPGASGVREDSEPRRDSD